MTNCKTKKRVSLEVSRGLHEKIKELATSREETMVSLVVDALHNFLETEHKIILRSKFNPEIYHTSNEYQFN